MTIDMKCPFGALDIRLWLYSIEIINSFLNQKCINTAFVFTQTHQLFESKRNLKERQK